RRCARIVKKSGSCDAIVVAPGGAGMERAVFVYTTYPSAVDAEKAGRAILAQRLAACVNILPGMVSHYWWEGKVERGEEAVMIVKTRASISQDVGRAIKALHSYTTRAILVIPLESVEQTYLGWLMKETEAATQT